MKNKLKNIAVIVSFAFIIFTGLTLTSCEEECSWYVSDDDGILTGYEDEDTCRRWDRQYSDVDCNCI